MHTHLSSYQPNRVWLVIVSGHFPNPQGILKMSIVCSGQGLECKGMLALRRHVQTPRCTYVMSNSLGSHLPSHSLGKILLFLCFRALVCKNTAPARDDCTGQRCNACSVLGTGLHRARTRCSSSFFSSSSSAPPGTPLSSISFLTFSPIYWCIKTPLGTEIGFFCLKFKGPGLRRTQLCSFV